MKHPFSGVDPQRHCEYYRAFPCRISSRWELASTTLHEPDQKIPVSYVGLCVNGRDPSRMERSYWSMCDGDPGGTYNNDSEGRLLHDRLHPIPISTPTSTQCTVFRQCLGRTRAPHSNRSALKLTAEGEQYSAKYSLSRAGLNRFQFPLRPNDLLDRAHALPTRLPSLLLRCQTSEMSLRY